MHDMHCRQDQFALMHECFIALNHKLLNFELNIELKLQHYSESLDIANLVDVNK